MYVLTDKEMRVADRYTIERHGVPSLALMERAGRALADEAERLAPNGKILCVCGGGNNGGDGFVCARLLAERGRCVETVFFAERMSEECRINQEKWTACGGEIFAEIDTNEAYALVVDCLVGTGLRGALEGKTAITAEKINFLQKNGARVLSADIPSGVNGENGLAQGAAVQADSTLCIGELKTGCFMADGLDFAGEVKSVDIGILLPETEDGYAELIDESGVRSILPKRKRNSHKGCYGKAAIVAGSMEYTGAAYLSAAACLRAGAGYTTLFVPKEILPYYVLKAPELLLKSISEGDRYAFNENNMRELLAYESVAYGMGMGVSKAVAEGAAYLLKNYYGRLILDADGLNSLSAYAKNELAALFANKKCDVLLTPHIKEFSRLSGERVQEIIENGVYAPKTFAKTHGVTVLLKNAASVITDGTHTALNTSGTSGQAKGGSGDVLSGVLAGLCAMGLNAFEAAKAGAYIVGKASELAVAEIGEYSLTATDVIAYLGRAFLSLQD